MDHTSRAVLAQTQVDATTNEITGFQPLLDGLDLAGRVLTADAIQTQREHADWLVTHKHAAYVLIVKANQPTLHHQLSTLPWRKVPVADHTRDRGHGRVELRRLQVITVAGLDFPHAAQAIRITHRVRSLHRRRWRTVSVYAVTSLAAAQASPARLRPEATGSPRPGGSGCRARPSGPGRTPPRGDHRLLHPHHLQRPDQSDAYKYAAYDGLQRLQARSSP